MYEQINTHALAFGKSVTKSAVEGNNLAVEGIERITRLQLKTLENRLAAADAFLSEALEVRDADGLRTIWPKGFNLCKETTEKLYANGQEVFNVMLRTVEALGQLARRNIDGASETFARAASPSKAAAS
jgi:Phasin protein